MNVEVDIEIAAPKERIWAAITDIENCADMISGIENINVLNQPENGVVSLKWEETRTMFGKQATETMWITEAEENRYYKTRAENHGTVYISKLALSEQGENSKLTMSFTAEAQTTMTKIFSALMGVFVKGSMKKMIAKDLADIKAFVEGDSTTG